MRKGNEPQDGLNDAFEGVPMGDFAEKCALKHSISRKEQDEHAAESYRRSLVRFRFFFLYFFY